MRTALLTLLVASLFAGSVGAQTEDPEWSEDMLERLRAAAEEFNESDGGVVGPIDEWFLKGTRGNLHVKARDGSIVVYSFYINEKLDVSRLKRGRVADPSVRVIASKRALERITEPKRPRVTIEQEVADRDIRIVRLFEPVPGLTIPIGPREALLTVGTLLVSLAMVRLGNLSTLLYSALERPAGGIKKLKGKFKILSAGPFEN